MRFTLTLLALAFFAAPALAERPPEMKDKATLVVVGTIEKIETKESEFGGDGVKTDYTAILKVKSVDRGKGVKEGDTVKIQWFHVTKKPTKPLPGAYGHGYKVEAKDSIKAYLLGEKEPYTVIYNSEGIEKAK